MSTQYPLHVAFLWHMHQPYYKDLRSGKYLMPWVRLHAVKDYLDMVELLREFPRIKANFNLVPSLIEQLQDFVENGATDIVWDITARPAADLIDGERRFILQKFFHANTEHMILPYPRYAELLEHRGWAKTDAELSRALQYFSEADFRDLQVWYNLTWIDPLHRETDEQLKDLILKGRDFTEQDKRYVLECHRSLCARVVDAYREAEARGQVELSCSAFYHPILPLIIDTELAHVARPQMALPRQRFSHPEDAVAQLRSGLAYHEKTFLRRPAGLWPSEGSVAPEIIPLLATEGIRWIATDEEVLAQSLGHQLPRDLQGNLQNPAELYQPYIAEHAGSRVAMVFRDHLLSDLIGFQYSTWDAAEAANDLVRRLEHIARSATSDQPLLVSIILDGENCWEHYAEDGLPFLRSLYASLTESELLTTTTISEFINAHPPRNTLPRLHAGSWINHDFAVWIGHKEDNQSWDYLHEVRELVVRHIEQNKHALTPRQVEAAWKEIYIAEGSDWNWWYGDDHSSGMDEEFDQLYRDHLIGACQAVDLQPPSFLLIPIVSKKQSGLSQTIPRAFLHPEIDGRDTNYYEWFPAGRFNPAAAGGAMHQTQFLVKRLYYGFDLTHFYFRIDANEVLLKPHQTEKATLTLHLITPRTWKLTLPLDQVGITGAAPHCPVDAHASVSVQNEDTCRFEPSSFTGHVAIGSIIEIAIPISDLGLAPGSAAHFYVTINVSGREIERCPVSGPLRIDVPEADFETRMWLV